MKLIFDGLWQTQVENSFFGLNTHAYFLMCKDGNVLFYNTSQLVELEEIEKLGGITYQYLSHRDEAGTSLKTIKEKFASTLCCAIKEELVIAPFCKVDITFSERVTHFSGVEVIPTPGHTEGSLSFLYQSSHGRTYLFTGDTFSWSNGQWETYFDSRAGASKAELVESLLIYRDLRPDFVIPSGSPQGSPSFFNMTHEEWVESIENYIKRLKN